MTSPPGKLINKKDIRYQYFITGDCNEWKMGKEKKNPRKSVPRELQTLTLLGDVQSQASGPAVERPCRARLPQPVGVSRLGRLSCPWGLQAVGFGAGTGRGMLVGLVGRSRGEASVIQKMIAVRT